MRLQDVLVRLERWMLDGYLRGCERRPLFPLVDDELSGPFADMDTLAFHNDEHNICALA